jgi:hypothetical protein
MSYKTLTNFDSNTLELRSVLGYRGSVNQAQLSLGALKDNAVGLRPGGNRYAWTVDLYGHRPLFAGLEGELEWTHQSWYGSSDYSPGLIDIVRRQNTGSTRATLTYPVTENSTLQLEWRQVHNNENISIFQYNSKQVQLSWRWHGGH